MGPSATALTWGKRALLGLMVVLLATFGLRATGSAVAKLDLADGSLWLASPPMGMVMQVNAASSEVLASVEVGTGSVSVAQSGHSALVLNRSLGELGRIDGSTLGFSTSPVSDGPSGDLQLVGNEHGAYVLDARGGRILVVDPLDRRVLHEVTVPQGPAQPRIDGEGRLWALVRATGTVVRVDPDGRSTDAGAAPADSEAELVLVDDRPYVVNPDADQVVPIDPETAEPGDGHCLGVRGRAGLESGGTTGASQPLALVVDAASGQLVTADLEAGTCSTLSLTEAQAPLPASFGQPVTQGERAFVPAVDKGQVLVVDLVENRLLTAIKVVEPNTRFELLVDDGNVWFNSLDGREAGTIDEEGITNLVYKWGEDDGGAGSGDGEGLALAEDGSGVDLDPGTGRVNADNDGEPTDGVGPDGLPREGDGDGPAGETSGQGGDDRPDALLELLPPEAGAPGSDLPPVPLPSGPSVAGPGPLGGGSTQRPLPVGPSGGTPDGVGRDLAGQTTDASSVVRLTPEFTYEPRVATINQPVRFLDTSRVPTGDPAPNSWTWDFGDGSGPGGGKDVSHVFSRAGTFTVTLTVSNGKETATTVGVAIMVVDPRVPGPPAPDFTFSPQNPQIGQQVRFEGRTIIDPPSCCPVTEWRWDFGDGSEERTGQAVTHTFTKAGEYTVTLTALNSASPGQISKPISVAVEVKPPVANFEWSPANPIAGQAVTFRDTSTGGVERRQWSVDGREPTIPTFTYTFSDPGEYVVRLTVANTIDGQVHTDTRTRTITVGEAARAPEITRVRPNPESPEVGETVNLVAWADYGPTSWVWDLGDGTTKMTAGGQRSEITHAWTAPGTYPVRVRALNDAGRGEATIPVDVTLAAQRMETSFQFNPGTHCVGNPAVVGSPVNFVSMTTGGTPPYTYTWDFGDGQRGQGKDVSHAYGSPGLAYVVTLGVTDSAGNEASALGQVCVVSEQVVTADFTWAPTKAVAGQPVQFTDLSKGSPTGHLWTFGDGSQPQLNVANPVHTFALPGSYRVTLYVTRDGRPSAPRSQIIEVSASVKDPPQAAFRVLEPVEQHVAGNPLTLEDVTAGPVAAPVFTITSPSGSSTQLSPEAGRRRVVHTFAEPGAHQVQMTVCWAEDGGNCGSTTQPVQISEAVTPPTATISISPVHGQERDGRKVLVAGQPITFSAVDQQPATSYSWSINGESPQGGQVTYTFSQAGDVPITLTATNRSGQAQAVEVVKVVLPVAPVADFDGPASHYQHAQATFTARPQGHVTSWYWTFSDNNQTADQPTVQHAFATPGEYQVTLVVANDWGEDAITKTIRVDPLSAPAPEVSMTGASQSGPVYTAPAGSLVTFTDASNPPPLTTWVWDFGDGTTADARTVERSFSVGTYIVRLTASNPAGTATVQLTLVVA